MSFSKQIVGATLVVTATVGALVFWGRESTQEEAPGLGARTVLDVALPSKKAGPSPTETEKKTAEKHLPPVPALARDLASARALVPARAWLVADFDGELVGQKPFADKEGPCALVPAPPRVAVALLPPNKGDPPDLLIAAPQVSDEFWNCARLRVEQSGGRPLAENERFQVLKSPSGVVAHGPGGGMVFLTSETHLEEALTVLSGLGENARNTEPHSRLFHKMHGDKSVAPGSVLDATLSVSTDWMTSLGHDAAKSPLRFIQSAYISSQPNGGAQGGIDCLEEGCEDVLAFLNRAKTDLLKKLPPATAEVVSASLTAHHLQGTGRIALHWAPTSAQLGTFLGRLFMTR